MGRLVSRKDGAVSRDPFGRQIRVLMTVAARARLGTQLRFDFSLERGLEGEIESCVYCREHRLRVAYEFFVQDVEERVGPDDSLLAQFRDVFELCGHTLRQHELLERR